MHGRPIRWIWWALWPAAVAVGLGAEATLAQAGDPLTTVLDLAVGWTIVACGLLGWRARPGSRTGALLAAAGFAWFLGNFGSPSNAVTGSMPAVREAAGQLTHLYRGLLVHAIVSYPTGRLTSRLGVVTVITAYALSLIPGPWRSDGLAILLGLAFGVAGWLALRDTARTNPAARLAQRAAVALASAVIGSSAIRIVAPAGGLEGFATFVFELSLVAVGVALLVGLQRLTPSRTTVADLVVELGYTRSGTLRDALATALGDPALQVGYWVPERGDYIDTDGRPVVLPADDPVRIVTRIERDGDPVAALVHDRAVLDDPRVLGAMSDAARLAASNATLQASVRARLSELEASRLRLVLVGDEELHRLEERLADGPVRRLHAIKRLLIDARAANDGASEAEARIDEAAGRLSTTLDELEDLAAVLRPRTLADQGLAGALAEIAARSEVPVHLSVPLDRWPTTVESTAYFVCAEGLSNIAKHARAAHVSIGVRPGDGWLGVEITDDGVGGADALAGTGLLGLSDRVEATGGRLEVVSPRGHGTRLVATIPIGDEAQ